MKSFMNKTSKLAFASRKSQVSELAAVHPIHNSLWRVGLPRMTAFVVTQFLIGASLRVSWLVIQSIPKKIVDLLAEGGHLAA